MSTRSTRRIAVLIALVCTLTAGSAGALDLVLRNVAINPSGPVPAGQLHAGNCNLISVDVVNQGNAPMQSTARVRLEIVRGGQVEYMSASIGYPFFPGQTRSVRFRTARVGGTSGNATVYLEVNPPRRLQSGGFATLPAPQVLEPMGNNTLNPGSVPVTGTCGGGPLAPRPERIVRTKEELRMKEAAVREKSLAEQRERFDRIARLPKAEPQVFDLEVTGVYPVRSGCNSIVTVGVRNNSSARFTRGASVRFYVTDRHTGRTIYTHAGLAVNGIAPRATQNVEFRNMPVFAHGDRAREVEMRGRIFKGGSYTDPNSGNNQKALNVHLQACGAYPAAPLLDAPGHNARPTSRNVTFSYSAVTGASHYKVCYSPVGVSCGTGTSFVQTVTGTSPTLTLPLNLNGVDANWTVASCRNGGAQCGNWRLPVRPIRATWGGGTGPSFGSTLLPAFQHGKCQSCHGMGNPQSSVVQRHVSGNRFAAGTDVTNSARCQGCHAPGAGGSAPKASGWHAPPTSMDFTGKTPTQLCNLARNHPGIGQHLAQDALILWAVDNGAFPGGRSSWRQTADQWVQGGRTCP